MLLMSADICVWAFNLGPNTLFFSILYAFAHICSHVQNFLFCYCCGFFFGRWCFVLCLFVNLGSWAHQYPTNEFKVTPPLIDEQKLNDIKEIAMPFVGCFFHIVVLSVLWKQNYLNSNFCPIWSIVYSKYMHWALPSLT